jgi:dienelactone hydrolase
MLDCYEPGTVQSILLMVPGGRCAARRYAWTAALIEQEIGVYVIDGAHSPDWPGDQASPEADGAQGQGPAQIILQLAEALSYLAGRGLPIHAAGHSAGAAAIFDALEPAANPTARLPENFVLPVVIDSVISLGCALQHRTLNMVFPHRSNDRALYRPPATRVVFLAGDKDAIAPPALVALTAARFEPPAEMVTMAGATHYGWAGPREDGDQIEFDRDAALDTTDQRERTLAYLAATIAGRPIQVRSGDHVWVAGPHDGWSDDSAGEASARAAGAEYPLTSQGTAMTQEYLTPHNVDDLGRMIVALVCELWITRDRLAVVEELLVEKGTIAPGAVDGFEWPADRAAAMEHLRDKVVGAIIGAPLAGQDRSIEAILERAGLRVPAATTPPA